MAPRNFEHVEAEFGLQVRCGILIVGNYISVFHF